jgi:GNAT superfamily N-acetyltransferase
VTDVIVRPTRVEDARYFAQFTRHKGTADSYGVEVGRTVDTWEARIRHGHNNGTMFTATIGGYIAGCAVVYVGVPSRLPILVGHKFRRLGVAKALLDAQMSWARANMRDLNFCLQVRHDNTAAIELFSSAGFVTDKSIPVRDGSVAMVLGERNE